MIERHHHHHGEESGEEEAKNSSSNVGIGFVKVMTDDQLETLRKQISVYATICEQLVQMHKNLTSHPDLPGVRLYCDPLLTAGGHKISARQRWTPTPIQLQILEGMFERGNGTPTKQKIKEITSELGQHGPISETNVYNWFQNRRARSKRKHQTSGPSVTGESEVETEVDSPKEKKITRPHELLSTAVQGDLCFQSSDMRFFDPQAGKGEPVFERDLPQMPFYDGLLSNQRNEQLTGKMEVNGGYGVYGQAEDYNMNGQS